MKMHAIRPAASGLAVVLLAACSAAFSQTGGPPAVEGLLASPQPPSEGSPPSGPPPVALSLAEAIRMAVEQNLDVRIARLAPEQSRQDEIAALAVFDPTLSGSYGKDKRNEKPTNFLGLSRSQADSYEVAAGQFFPTGTKAELSWATSRQDTQARFPIDFNPSYGSSVRMSFSQPLLRGFRARREKAEITIARTGVEVSRHDLSRTVMNQVRSAADAYWELVAAIRNLEVARKDLGLAGDLLKLNKAKVEVGTLAPIEITQAEAGVASREEAVIVAENAIRTAEDALRRVLNVSHESELWNRPILPTDAPPPPASDASAIALDGRVSEAIANRPELKASQLRVKTLELRADVARNDARPSLDLTGYYALSGASGDRRFGKFLFDSNGDGTVDAVCNEREDPLCDGIPYDGNLDGTQDYLFVAETVSDAWRDIGNGDFPSWGVGLNFTYPIRNRAARAALALARLAVEQGRLELENAERGVEIEVRNAVRQVETSVKRVNAARVNLELQRKKLEAEQKRYQYGMSTSFQVLEFQKDLALAEFSEIRALIDYNKSLIELARATGSVLEQNGIRIE